MLKEHTKTLAWIKENLWTFLKPHQNLHFLPQERIRIKTIAFEQRAKEIKERLSKDEEAETKKQEEAREQAKRRDSDSEKSRKIEQSGEEKYEQNNSFSGSFGKFSDELHDFELQRRLRRVETEVSIGFSS